MGKGIQAGDPSVRTYADVEGCRSHGAKLCLPNSAMDGPQLKFRVPPLDGKVV